MKNKLIQFPLCILLFNFVLFSCDSSTEDDEIPQEYEYLVDTELIKSYSETFISTFLQLAKLEYPELAEIEDNFSSGVKVYKITYNTEFEDETLQASGLVCLPDEAGTYPVLSYQNGTNTLHSNAPSVNPDDELFSILEIMASTGFIIAIPDYIGFGESDYMFHPYLHKTSTVQSVTDMLNAVEEMLEAETNTETNKDLYLAGYSQGGWATMAVQQYFDTENETSFTLKGSACGAGPYNLITINEYITGLATYPQPYFLGYIFNSYINLGLTTAINDIFQQPFADLIPTLYDGTKSGTEINAELTTTIPDLFTSVYINEWKTNDTFSSVTDFMEENSIYAYVTETPTMILHGTEDNYIPPSISTNIYEDFINLGVSSELVTLVYLDGYSHTTAVIPSGLASIIWFIELKENS